MIFIIRRKWTLATCLFIVITPGNVQVAVPMYPAPIYAAPAISVAVALPIGVPLIPKITRTTTTTTTTESPYSNNGAIAFPMPVPVPVPMPVAVPFPAMPPPSPPRHWPKKPDSCERNKRPRPHPYPLPAFAVPVVAPPPVVIVPFPPPRLPRFPSPKRPSPDTSDTSYTSCSSSSSTSSECDTRRRRRSKRRKGMRTRLYVNRRAFNPSEVEVSDDELVKPMLSYVARNGDIKFNRRISKYEADRLLREDNDVRKIPQTVQVVAESHPENSRVEVISKDSVMASPDGHKRRQVVLRKGGTRHILGEGKKEIVFKPPADKTITNLSVSFQIT